MPVFGLLCQSLFQNRYMKNLFVYILRPQLIYSHYIGSLLKLVQDFIYFISFEFLLKKILSLRNKFMEMCQFFFFFSKSIKKSRRKMAILPQQVEVWRHLLLEFDVKLVFLNVEWGEWVCSKRDRAEVCCRKKGISGEKKIYIFFKYCLIADV